MDTKAINRLIQKAVEATEKACSVILEVYHSGNFQTEAKRDHSPLTLADRKANEVITEILQPLGLSILSEEGKLFHMKSEKIGNTFGL